MALSVTSFSLVLVCLTLASTSQGVSSREEQKCGDKQFYCPPTNKCIDREQRCTGLKVCVDLLSGVEAKCFEDGPGRYEFYKKRSSMSSISSSSNSTGPSSKRVLDPVHWFVQYRGFVYEFGGYLFQELDVNDPNYKYGPLRGEATVLSEELVGSSRCTREQVRDFVNRWLQANPKYHLLKSNCQHFTKKLLKELGKDCQGQGTENLKAPSECYELKIPMRPRL